MTLAQPLYNKFSSFSYRLISPKSATFCYGLLKSSLHFSNNFHLAAIFEYTNM